MVATIVLSVLLLLSLFTAFWSLARGLVPGPRTSSRHAGPTLQEAIVEDNDSGNKVLVVPIEGIITSNPMDEVSGYNLVEYIRDQFKLAEEDSDVKAVILKVDSPGGEVLASDEIYGIIRDFQKKSKKPVVASMGNLAASGGYYVSAPCRWIVANELTLTGSIGVIFHSFNFRGLMDKVGVRPEVYKSGKYKDMLSFDKQESEITPEEKAMMTNLVLETYARFKSVVADGRQWAHEQNEGNKAENGRELSSEWQDYADGRVLSGKKAYDLGFVDELGNFKTAVARARTLAHIKDANVVKYQQVFDLSRFLRIFGKSDAQKLKVDIGVDVPKLKAGQLYFLSPVVMHW